MSKNYVKADTLFLIGCFFNDQIYYLGNPSSITNDIILDKDLHYSKIQNFLFYVENQFKHELQYPKQFYSPLVFKHKYSNKYLNFAEERGQQSYEGNQLCLSHTLVKWSALPCYKYQVKNTQNIEFGSRIYITQEDFKQTSLKSLFIKQHIYQQNRLPFYQMLFGFNLKSQIILIRYHHRDESNFHFGQMLKIYHQESYAFLVDSTPVKKIYNLSENDSSAQKNLICFKNQNEDIGETQLDCIWMIQQAKSIKGQQIINGTLFVNSQIKIKHLLTGKYLTLKDNSIDDENYEIVGQQSETIYSNFQIQPVRVTDKHVGNDTQLRLKHVKIYQYMAVSKVRESHTLIEIIMDKMAQDEHFYQLKRIPFQYQLTVFFIIHAKKQLMKINRMFYKQLPSQQILQSISKFYSNLHIDLSVIEQLEFSQKILKQQLTHFIPLIVRIIASLQEMNSSENQLIKEIKKHNYIFLHKIIIGHSKNQLQTYKFIHIYLKDLFQDLFVEQFLIEMFKNNMKILAKISIKNQFLNENIVTAIFNNIKKDQKDAIYWEKMLKILDLLGSLIKIYDQYIDINQRLVVLQLFGSNKIFDQLLFQIKFRNSQLFVCHPTRQSNMLINNIKDPAAIQLITKIFSFISSLCQGRNIISKKLIDAYLNLQDRQDQLKTIINCFYIRNDKVLRGKVLLLLANIYLDSFPRVAKYYPINVLKMDVEARKVAQVHDAASQIAELSHKLRESIMIRAQSSHQTKPLSGMKNLINSQNMQTKKQPSYTVNEVNELKQVIILLVQTEKWNLEILKILKMMVSLSLLSDLEKYSIFKSIFTSIQLYISDKIIMKEIILILELIVRQLQQQMLLKVNLYCIYIYYKQKQEVDKQDCQYIFHNNKKITFSDKITISETHKQLASQYNKSSQKIDKYYQNTNYFQTLLNLFIKNQYDPQTMMNYLDISLKFYRPGKQITELLASTLVVSQIDLPQYNQLLTYSYQIKNLTETSEQWLCNSDKQAEDYNKFYNLLTQVNNFMYDGYILDSQEGKNYRKKKPLNKNRQIVMKNIGFYTYLLNLLGGNYYLLEGESLKTLSRKIRLSFEKCFQFLYDFCFQCEENKEIMSRQMQIIKKFANLLQTGQTNLWILLIRNNKKIIQQTTQQDFQNLVFKIVKNRTSSSYANCDYSPLYIDQIMVLLDINHTPYMPNILKIAKVLKQTILFKKMLYLREQSDKKNIFCLQLFKFRMDPTQVPVIYHTRLINFLLYIIKALGSRDTSVKRSLKSFITLQYVFQMLTVEDSFTHDGIPADMNFLFKKQLLKLLQLYLSQKTIDSEVFGSVTITKFLKFYKKILTQNILKSQSIVDNQMLYFPYTQKEEQSINFFVINNKAFYLKYLRKIFIRLNDIFSKIHHKQLDDNYQLIALLLDQQRLKKLNKKGQQKDLTFKANRKIITKWSHLLPMSEQSPKHEAYTKKKLYSFLSNDAYKNLYDQEKNNFFVVLQQHEDDFIHRILSILKSFSNKFEDFHQQPLSELLFTFSSYIEYKIDKKQQLFSGDVLKPKLSDSFTILIIPLMQIVCLNGFDYKKHYCRRIFHYLLTCINKILSFKRRFDMHQNILEFLQNELNSGDKFLDSLKQALLEMIEEEAVQSSIQQINTAQNLMFLLGQQQKIQPLLPSLILIRQLCRYSVFTEYFRNQQTNGSIDFLQIIFKNLMTILQRREQVINIVLVERIEYLCQCIASFFTGVNKANQQFIIERDFIKEIEYILKIFSFKQDKQKNENTKNLISQISKSYGQCLPFYNQLLTDQWTFLTFNHFYVINNLKTSLIKVILASVITNNNTIQTIRAIMSLELLKLNIIILYEENIVSDQQINQRLFIDQFRDWKDVYKNKENYTNSYSLITYGLFLIRLFEEDLGSIDDQCEPVSKYSQTLKQKSYEDYLPKQIKLLLKQMKDQPFFQNITLFYQKFFEAYRYFIEKMIQVELVLQNGQITLVIFPQLPLCKNLTSDMKQELRQQSNRTNQQEKNKSMLLYSQQFYEQVQGQIDYNDSIKQNMKYGNHLIKIFSYNHSIYISICVVSILITTLYIIQNYLYFQTVSPPLDLATELANYFTIYTSGIQAILIISQIISLSLGIILGLFLIVKKIPLYFSIHMKSFHKLTLKERIGLSKSQLTHALSNLFSSVSIELFLSIFASLSIIHPFFSGFILLYIVSKLFMGKIIIKMLKLSWFQISIVISVIIAFNFLFTMIIYVQLTTQIGYGPACTSTMSCFKMIMNMILKGGFVVWNPSSYDSQRIDFRNFVEISHQVFIVGIIMNIFGGLIIDTISFLRQKSANIQLDEQRICFICGLTQLAIDLQLQGYKKHKEKIHNPQYYIDFIFYLKRKKNNKYLFYEDYVSNQIYRDGYQWMPFETSLKHRKLHPLGQNVQFKDKYLESLYEKNGQVRRTLYNTIRLENQLKDALNIEDNSYFNSESLLKIPSPNKSRMSSNKSFRSF